MKHRFNALYKYALALLLPVIIGMQGCTFDKSESPTTPTENTSSVKTQINGIVVDESGKPVNGAVVTAYGKITTTSKYGTFMFTGIDVPGNRAVVSVKKPGYFDAFRAEQPTAGSATYYRIGLMSNAPQGSFTSASGGTITAAGSTATVSFPANGYVKSDGTPYTGTVNYVVRHLNPTSRNFFDFFSGDFRGVRTDGSFTEMVSYGVLRVELTGSNGEKLNLGNGKTATLKYPIATQQTASAPSSMPLWYYDEAKGMWKEEGSATKNGAFYEGTVTHFTDWNCDVPNNTATLTIRVQCDSIPLPGLNVQIGHRLGITNANGLIFLRVPTGVVFNIKVFADLNNGLESKEVIVGPLKSEDNSVIDLTMMSCPAIIKGTLYECDNNLSEFATEGIIVVKYPDGLFTTGYTDQNGMFSIIVRSRTIFDVFGLTIGSKESSPITVNEMQSNDVIKLGKITACTFTGLTYIDLEVGKLEKNEFPYEAALINEGSKVLVRKQKFIEIIDIETKSIVKKISIDYNTTNTYDTIEQYPYELSYDEHYILVKVLNNTWEIIDLISGNILTHFEGLQIAHLSRDGRQLIGYTSDSKSNNTILLYNALDGTEISRFTFINGLRIRGIYGMSDFLTDSTVAIRYDSGSYDNIRIINIKSGSHTNTIQGGMFRVIKTSQDGKIIVLHSPFNVYKTVRIYNTIENKTILDVGLDDEIYVSTLTFCLSPTNDYFAMQLYHRQSSYAYNLEIFNMNGKLIKTLPTIPGVFFLGVNFSSDSKKLAALYKWSNSKMMLRIWSV